MGAVDIVLHCLYIAKGIRQSGGETGMNRLPHESGTVVGGEDIEVRIGDFEEIHPVRPWVEL